MQSPKIFFDFVSLNLPYTECSILLSPIFARMLNCKQPVARNSIPRVKELCRLLDFGDACDRPEQDLKDSTQAWRKQYVANDGTRGKDLIHWRSAETQSGLRHMTKDFLHVGGNGLRYWSLDDYQYPKKNLEYPRDEQK